MKLPEVRMMSIDKIDINPYRNLKSYPIIRAKVDALKASFSTVGVWPSIMARRPQRQSPTGFWPQRMAALRNSTSGKFGDVADLSDEQMVQYMGRENGEDYNATSDHANTWEAGLHFVASGTKSESH